MERIVSKRGDVIASEFPDGQAEIAAIRKTLGFCIGQRSNAHREVVIERADDRERNRFSIRHPNGAVMLRVSRPLQGKRPVGVPLFETSRGE